VIVYKDWVELKDGKRYVCEGYFLFGKVPLFISKYDPDVPGNSDKK